MREQIIMENGKVGYIVTEELMGIMGRRKRTRVKILDIKVKDGLGLITVEIRRSTNVWTKSYGLNPESMNNWDQQKFFDRIKEDALKLETDQRFEDAILSRLEHEIGKDIDLG